MRFLLTLIFFAVCAQAAQAGRVALVLGNSSYQNAPSLPNAAQDARDMTARLEGMGFRVLSGIDLDRRATMGLIQQFSDALGEGDLALFFYAGHGAQIGTENYVIPVDAAPRDEATLSEASVKLQTVLRSMELRADRRIVILDACRNNPFLEKLAGRSIGGAARGLAKVEAGVGSYIAFSTQPGNIALDGDGKNSPFTAALLRHIDAPGADIHAIMRQVRGDVVAQTNQTQIPWENSSLVDALYLTGTTATQVAPQAAPQPQPQAQPQTGPRQVQVTLHAVMGLDPNGDGFLALRSGTDGNARRLAKMPEGTPLEILSQGNPWWRVRTLDGLEGFAHSGWIGCCVSVMMPAQQGFAAPAPVPDTGQICNELWYARNLIWHLNGYCFTSDRGRASFDNSRCAQGRSQDQIQMSRADRAEVQRLVGLEAQNGCR